MTFQFQNLLGVNCKCLVFRYVLHYIVHVLHRFSLQSVRSKCHVKRRHYMQIQHDGNESVPDFVSTMSRTIKCNHCSKLLVNQQGLFYTVKKPKENCIVFTDVSTHKIVSILFKNLSIGFILKIFLKFRKFQPRYSYKIYYKKRVYVPSGP